MGVTSTFLLNGGTWFPLTMKLSHKSTILTREKTVPSPCPWLTLYLFRADPLTNPLPGVSWKTTSKVMFCYFLTFF